ncbi:MAG: hypothetical protein DWP97_10830, partial [Calditrichaeota bacterium]
MFKVDFRQPISDINSMLLIEKRLQQLIYAFGILLFSLSIVVNSNAADLAKYASSDLSVLYLFEDEKEIDWPTIYYLNDNFGAAIHLVYLIEKPDYSSSLTEVENKEIYLHRIGLPDSEPSSFKMLFADLFKTRYPDIVIFDERSNKSLYKAFRSELKKIQPSQNNLFNILKFYEYAAEDKNPENNNSVVLNSREFYNRYKDRIQLEVPQLFANYEILVDKFDRIRKYNLVQSNLPNSENENNFIGGITDFRLLSIIDSILVDGPMKKTIAGQAKKYSAFFKSSLYSFGKSKVDNIVAGFREMRYLRQHARVNSQHPEYNAYIEDLYQKAERATLALVGINWDGKIVLRDSPQGTRLKFIASISVDGPKEVEVNSILFHPYWDSVDVALNDSIIQIQPHQSYVKEFLIESDRSYLEAQNPDSLAFSVEIMYGQIPLRFTNKIPVWKKPELHVNLEPNFYFVKPFPEVDIDKVVANLNVKVIISKPYDYTGMAKIEFTTPMGLYAGAYRQDIQLTAGTLNETIRIPFTISNLFELGTQLQIVHLKIDNAIVASDTSKVRIASCNISDTRKIGFLPDEDGKLEDILSMTDAAYRPLTDRTLVKGDLEAYDVIVIGTNSFRKYDSFSKLK